MKKSYLALDTRDAATSKVTASGTAF